MKKPKRYDTPGRRACRVLTSQGKPPGAVLNLPESVITKLAVLCDEAGTLAANVRSECKRILDAHYDHLKAAVDEGSPATAGRPRHRSGFGHRRPRPDAPPQAGPGKGQEAKPDASPQEGPGKGQEAKP